MNVYPVRDPGVLMYNMKAFSEVRMPRKGFFMTRGESSAVLGRLYAAASRVHESRNARCRVNELPPEVLALVFAFVPSPVGPGPASATAGISNPRGAAPHSRARRTRDLVPLTHVCRHWRALALATPALWTSICEDGPGPARTAAASAVFLARAKHAPLTVHINRPAPSAALVTALASPAPGPGAGAGASSSAGAGESAGARVAELDLHDLRALSPPQLVAQLLSFPAPRLLRATVRYCAERAAAQDPDDANADAPELEPPAVALFAGTAPRLEDLTLHDVPFLPANALAALRRLRLSFDVTAARWTPRDLVRLLPRLPVLEELRVSGASAAAAYEARDAGADEEPSAGVLPCLRTFEVSRGHSDDADPAAFAREVLSRVSLPSRCNIRLRGVPARRLVTLTDLHLPHADTFTRFSVDVTFTAISLVASTSDSLASFSAELETAGATKARLQSCVIAFATAGPAAAARSVSVASQRAWAAWCDASAFLSALSNVAELEICDTLLADELLDSLRTPLKVPDDTQSASLPCSRLETLRLPPGTNPVEKLEAICSERKARGGLCTAFESARPCIPL